MSGFWDSELGEVSGLPGDAFAKTFTHIPDGTLALAKIESFANAEYNGSKYLSIDWILIDGDFKGQKVNQKLKVFGDSLAKDSEKARFRALNMLKLLYQLFNVKPKHPGEPSDQDLAVFIGKDAGLKIRETEPNDQGRQYNWVAEVHPAKGFVCETGKSLVVHTVMHAQGIVDSAFARNGQYNADDDKFSDNIPF